MNRILIIEDEASLREDIVDILRFEGFTALVATNGKEGIAVAKQELPDLILCDIMMPELDGYQVLLRLRTHPPTATIPLIFLTALNTRHDTRYGMELGAEDYITKPFRSHELIKAVRIQLRKQALIADLASQQLNELRDQVLFSVPHELRTPLVGIMGYAELIGMDAARLSPHEIADYAGMIFSSATRLHHLLENYIYYVQLQALRFDTERVATMRRAELSHPDEIIEVAAQQIVTHANRSRDLCFNVMADCVIHMAQNYLEKIIEELISNALKFSEDGKSIELSTAANPTYTIVIQDHGRGIYPEHIAQIAALRQFDRRTYEQQGSGMGLAIVREIITLHGGELAITSTEGEGTTITVKLL